ncbi:MAG: hypothetical protein CMM75_10095 [Rhodospirillaceae bacterium]|nr:hypothetical protein [Rhodospirillaceae bacterium]MQF86555.1 phosphocholine cytidylyltransferase family protein [SAR202 cluster bacterium]
MDSQRRSMTEIPTSVIVIAAGFGSRLMPLTEHLPKCMLPVQSVPILHRTLETFDQLGIEEKTVIGGYKAENLAIPTGVNLLINSEYQSNNILHSLAYARNEFVYGTDTIVCYSDIIFQKAIAEQLLESSLGDIILVVDRKWQTRYVDRELHLIAEAEAANFDAELKLLQVGKTLLTSDANSNEWGEFLGLVKFTSRGAQAFWDIFDKINQQLAPDEPFQAASEWQKSYLTDLFQELIDRGISVHCLLIDGGWEEIDNREDYDYAQVFKFTD